MEPIMIQDAQGHYLSGATAEAAAVYDKAARAFNLVHGDAIGRTAATLTLERGGERRIDLGFELVLRDSG